MCEVGLAGRTRGGQATYWLAPSWGCWCIFLLDVGFRPRTAPGRGAGSRKPLTTHQMCVCLFLDIALVTHFLEREEPPECGELILVSFTSWGLVWCLAHSRP